MKVQGASTQQQVKPAVSAVQAQLTKGAVKGGKDSDGDNDGSRAGEKESKGAKINVTA